MKKLLKVVCVVSLAIALFGCSNNDAKGETKDVLQQIKDSGKLIIGTSPDFAPYEFYAMKDGEKKIVGYEMSLAQAIADEIGVELVITATDFDTVKLNVQSEEVHMGIAGFSRTPTREATFNFSESYLNVESDGWQGIIVRTEDVDKYKSINEIKNAKLKIGAQAGSIQYELAALLTDTTKIVPLGTTTDCALQLSVGEIDAFICTSASAELLFATYDHLTILPEATFDLDPEDIYGTNGIIFPKEAGYESLIEVVNKVIKEAEESGQMTTWYEEAVKLQKYEVE